ncbi:hypothetical protein E2C01_084272 [Portunus trituberculatus]|uniref:Uncharacterized protein n=1 Tax=Portunus trituberculatus TaxID=210409 RepID=A0A5B7IZH9_PORTR|nr:hypothetical protein [Portunus trituberculatus]
MHHSVSLERS